MKNTNLNLVFTTLFLFFLFPHHLVGEGYSLAECRELALKNNVAVKNAALEVAASEQTKRAAFTNYFPTVSATGTSGRPPRRASVSATCSRFQNSWAG